MAHRNDINDYDRSVLSSFLNFFEALIASVSGLIIAVLAAIVDDHVHYHDSHKILWSSYQDDVLLSISDQLVIDSSLSPIDCIICLHAA